MSVRGESGWQATYQKAFGKDRWQGLVRALRGAVNHVVLVNPFLPPASQGEIRQEKQLKEHESIPGVYICDEELGENGELEDDDGLLVPKGFEDTAADACNGVAVGTSTLLEEVPNLLPCYFLDGASAIAALALGAKPGDAVLDLCSAPGGKATVIATTLFPPGPKGGVASTPTGKLVCNESSRPRAQRLHRVVSSFLPAELVQAGGNVHMTITDAIAKPGIPPVAIQRMGPYDRILVDAPCTSDRHLAQKGKGALAHWATGAVKANAERQFELLRVAATMVRKGGIILYCTCALSEMENDGVVAKFLKRTGDSFRVAPVADPSCLAVELLSGAEETASGMLFLPDRSPYGPMYIARLQSVA